jgi:hypothetical protein
MMFAELLKMAWRTEYIMHILLRLYHLDSFLKLYILEMRCGSVHVKNKKLSFTLHELSGEENSRLRENSWHYNYQYMHQLAEWLGLQFQSSGSWVHIPPSGPVCMYW